MYLDSQIAMMSAMQETDFAGYKPVHGRIHHPGEQVDAVELLGRPPDEGLLGPLPGAAETVTQNRTKNMRLGF